MTRSPEVQALVEALAVTLPADYLAYLDSSQGFEGEMGENYVHLWDASRVRSYNADPLPWEREMIRIGSNGATEFFVIVCDGETSRYVLMNACGATDDSELIALGTTFADFLAALAQPWFDRAEA
jgi:hypothetical protein